MGFVKLPKSNTNKRHTQAYPNLLHLHIHIHRVSSLFFTWRRRSRALSFSSGHHGANAQSRVCSYALFSTLSFVKPSSSLFFFLTFFFLLLFRWMCFLSVRVFQVQLFLTRGPHPVGSRSLLRMWANLKLFFFCVYFYWGFCFHYETLWLLGSFIFLFIYLSFFYCWCIIYTSFLFSTF